MLHGSEGPRTGTFPPEASWTDASSHQSEGRMGSMYSEQGLSLIMQTQAVLISTTNDSYLPLLPKFKAQYQTETPLGFCFLCSRLPVSLPFPGSVLRVQHN